MNGMINKNAIKDMLYLLAGAVIYSIGTHSFIEPANIAPGGAVGIALMGNYVTELSLIHI